MLNFQADVQKTVDAKKIQEYANKANAVVLVGFASGREHVETLHHEKRNDAGREYGEYRSYNGGDPAQNKPIDTAELARELHFGTANIPARPFLEEGILFKKKELAQAIGEQVKAALNGRANWDKVGTMAVGAIQEFVRSDYYRSNVPNSQKTIDYKGSDTPLIDGGDLVGAIDYVVDGGKK